MKIKTYKDKQLKRQFMSDSQETLNVKVRHHQRVA